MLALRPLLQRMSHNPTHSPGAVVIGANYRGLSVVRSLGRQGIETFVIRTDEHVIANYSRYTSRTTTFPAGSHTEHTARLRALARTEGLKGWALIPTDDADVDIAVAHHDELEEVFRVAVPPAGAAAWTIDKRSLYAFAAQQGVEYPQTQHVPDEAALDALQLDFPMIVKPRFRHGLERPPPKAWPALDRQQLARSYRAATALMPSQRLLVQELIPGGGESQLTYGALCRDGAVLASVAARRIRQWPRDFGMASTYVETIDDAELVAPAQRLLTAARYTGLVELEFKRDARDGRLKLLDANPRAWGWISIGKAAGVDFPYLLWRMLAGLDVPPRRGIPGVRWVRLTTDLAAAAAEHLAGTLSLSDYLRSLRAPLACAIFAPDDPLPGLVDAPVLAAIGARRVLREGRRRVRPPTHSAQATRPAVAERPQPGGSANGNGGPPRVRPRALIIVENAPVPGDRRVWNEAQSLSQTGWAVTVLAPHAWRGAPRPRDEVIEGITIRRFRVRQAEDRKLGHLGEYGTGMWRIWREVHQLARGRPFDVIQACNPPDFLLLAALGQRRRGSRLIFDHHDLAPEMYVSRLDASNPVVHRILLALERLAFRVSDVALATNGSVGRLAVERNHKSAADVFVVRNGPRLERFRPVPPDPTLARGRAHLLVYVGLMGPQDGVDHALRALADLKKRRDDWHALFIGDGEMLPGLRQLTAELGLDDHVEFSGYQPDEEVRRAISSADVCLAPDPRNPYTDFSTLVKIAKYMALAKPVVSYDLVESRVTAGDAALFAGDNDPAQFARMVDELLDDPARREALGTRGRGRVESGLAWEHSEPMLLSAYKKAMTR